MSEVAGSGGGDGGGSGDDDEQPKKFRKERGGKHRPSRRKRTTIFHAANWILQQLAPYLPGLTRRILRQRLSRLLEQQPKTTEADEDAAAEPPWADARDGGDLPASELAALECATEEEGRGVAAEQPACHHVASLGERVLRKWIPTWQGGPLQLGGLEEPLDASRDLGGRFGSSAGLGFGKLQHLAAAQKRLWAGAHSWQSPKQQPRTPPGGPGGGAGSSGTKPARAVSPHTLTEALGGTGTGAGSSGTRANADSLQEAKRPRRPILAPGVRADWRVAPPYEPEECCGSPMGWNVLSEDNEWCVPWGKKAKHKLRQLSAWPFQEVRHPCAEHGLRFIFEFLDARGLAAVFEFNRARHVTQKLEEARSVAMEWLETPISAAAKQLGSVAMDSWKRGWHGTHGYAIASILNNLGQGGLATPPYRQGVYLHRLSNRNKAGNYCVFLPFPGVVEEGQAPHGPWFAVVVACSYNPAVAEGLRKDQILVRQPEANIRVESVFWQLADQELGEGCYANSPWIKQLEAPLCQPGPA
ncbi:MAG: hypothetical protein GY772_21635 [bacterium]|nr:hypothetical protein [bacterium]